MRHPEREHWTGTGCPWPARTRWRGKDAVLEAAGGAMRVMKPLRAHVVLTLLVALAVFAPAARPRLQPAFGLGEWRGGRWPSRRTNHNASEFHAAVRPRRLHQRVRFRPPTNSPTCAHSRTPCAPSSIALVDEAAECADLVRGRLCAEFEGFSLHAKVTVGGCARERLEKLCRCVAQPSLSQERLRELPDGRVVYELARSNPRAFRAQILRRLRPTGAGPRSAARRTNARGLCASRTHAAGRRRAGRGEEARQPVVSAVLALDETFRQVILLCYYYEDLPQRAIARRLCVPAATVRTRLSRALDKLRTRLDEGEAGRRAWAAPLVAWLGAAAVCLLCSGLALQLEPRLPAAARQTPVAA